MRNTLGISTVAAHLGAKIINDNSAHTISASMIVFSPTAIVVSIKMEGSDDNVVSDYITTPGSAVGDYWCITATKSRKITQVQLGAGSANYAI